MAILLALVALAPRPAHAEDEDKARAKRLLASGSAKYEASDFEGALSDFIQAYSAVHNPKILFNIGQAYRHLQNPQPAKEADAFSQFLKDTANDLSINARQLEEARHVLAELRASEVEQVQLDITPRDAHVELDGLEVKRSFHLRKKPAGELDRAHELKVSAAGYQDLVRPFTLAELAPQKFRLRLELVRQAEASNAAPAVLIPVPVASDAPGAKASEKKPEVTPAATQLAAAQKPARDPDLGIVAAPPPRNHTPAFVALGVGGALAVGAAAVGLAALNQKHGLSCGTQANPCVGKDAQTAASAHNTAKVADLLWLGAAAAGITGGVLWFVAPAGAAGSGGEVGVTGQF